MTFIGNTQLPKNGNSIVINIPGDPGYELKVPITGSWIVNKLGVPLHINFMFFLLRESFPLEFVSPVVILDTINEAWTVHIKDGSSTIIQEVTVNIVHD